jgi:hypothetical protein
MHVVLQALGRRSWHAAAPIPPAHATRSLWQHLPTTQLLPQLLPDVSWPLQILCLLTTSHLPNENEAFSMNRHQHTFHLGRCSARTVDGAKDANFLVRPLFAPLADARRSPSMVMTMDGLQHNPKRTVLAYHQAVGVRKFFYIRE